MLRNYYHLIQFVQQQKKDKKVYMNLSKKVIMIVVGGKNSSNTTKLYEIAKKIVKNTIHIENAK